MGIWIILVFSTFLLAPCDACVPTLHIRNQIDGRQVEGFIVKKFYDYASCKSNNVGSYIAPKGGEARSNWGSCQLLYVTAKLKIPVTPPINNVPIVGNVPSLTLPGNEEQCRTYVETSGWPNNSPGYPYPIHKYLYVKRNVTTNECVIVEG